MLPAFEESLLPLKDYFLILDGCKVRFVSLIEQQGESLSFKGAQILCYLSDFSLNNELKVAKSVYMAVDNKTHSEAAEAEKSLIGMDVLFEDKVIGTVIDLFHNKAHYVVVVENEEGQEFLLPDVAEYVVSKDYENNTITFTNIAAFLEL